MRIGMLMGMADGMANDMRIGMRIGMPTGCSIPQQQRVNLPVPSPLLVVEVLNLPVQSLSRVRARTRGRRQARSVQR